MCGVRDKTHRNSKQGMNQNKVGNMHFHPLLQQSLSIFLNPGIYMDTRNSVMPAHKVKPGYHHRHLASGDTGVCSVRQLQLRGLGVEDGNQGCERRSPFHFYSLDLPPSEEMTPATSQSEECQTQTRKESVLRSISSAIKIAMETAVLVLVPSPQKGKDVILALLSCGHLETADLTTDYKSILLPE